MVIQGLGFSKNSLTLPIFPSGLVLQVCPILFFLLHTVSQALSDAALCILIAGLHACCIILSQNIHEHSHPGTALHDKFTSVAFFVLILKYSKD